MPIHQAAGCRHGQSPRPSQRTVLRRLFSKPLAPLLGGQFNHWRVFVASGFPVRGNASAS